MMPVVRPECSWREDVAYEYDKRATYARKLGAFDLANLEAEYAHQVRAQSDYYPLRAWIELPLLDRIVHSRWDVFEWDDLREEGVLVAHTRPKGPTRNGSSECRSGSVASGGTKLYCSCRHCF